MKKLKKDKQDFFKWLKETDQLDMYEAMLDTSRDYVGDQELRLMACERIEKLVKKYDERN